MPTSLLLMQFGSVRWLVLPLPIFLLWPLMLLIWLVLGLLWLVTPERSRSRSRNLLAGFAALRLIWGLRGTRVDLRGHANAFSLRFV
jgi:hypothetical protein